jgi:hypothetical protein
LARGWVFSGSIAIRPRSSWATRVPWRSGRAWDYGSIDSSAFRALYRGQGFVAEALSVIIQRMWFKYQTPLQRRRVFLMAPLHHHFEKKGWYESQVVTRFYILCVLCAMVALSTLKIR